MPLPGAESRRRSESHARRQSTPARSPGSPRFDDAVSPAHHRKSLAVPGTERKGSLTPGSPMKSPKPRRGSHQGRGSTAGAKAGGDDESGSSNVKVFLRVRPFNKREIKIHEEISDTHLRSIIDMPGGPFGNVDFMERVKVEDDDEEYHVQETFVFDRCMWSITPEQQPYDYDFCSQEVVFHHLGQAALDNAWKGFNTCIFAYGQTGAGKTHTMMGHFDVRADSSGCDISGDPGVIPQLCRALYSSIDERKQSTEDQQVITVKFEIELSAYEIYNERVRDLFFMHTPGRKSKDELKVRKHPLEGPFVDGISKLRPTTWPQCIKDIEDGNSHRTVGATAMNSESSRSHSIFQIKFIQIETSIPKEKFEKPVTNRKYSIINLIDLAGSERNKKSQAQGERLVEATNINLSLTTLKRVIDALVHNSNPKAQQKQVPYRDSVLTMLLSHSLGGNSKTMMVACVSPHHDNAEETLNTLRYASQARKIVNVVRVNEDTKAKQNLLLKEQLAALQKDLEDRKAGNFSSEEINALEDEIKLGQQMMQDMEMEAKRLQAEKEEEVEKRYQQAFQHSFQMVLMRKQKERAQREAAKAGSVRDDMERLTSEREAAAERLSQLKREASNLRRVKEDKERETQELKAAVEADRKAREAMYAKAYGWTWIEKQRRILAEKQAKAQLGEAERSYRAEIDAIIENAAKEYKELQSEKEAKEREGDEMTARSEAYNEMSQTAERERRAAEAKAEEYNERFIKSEEARVTEVKELERKHRLELSEITNKGSIEREVLQRELDELRLKTRTNEEISKRENDQRRRTLENNLSDDFQRQLDESERKHKKELRQMEEQLSQLRIDHFEEVKKLRSEHHAEKAEQTANYQKTLTDYTTKIEEQSAVLNDVNRREVKYRELHHQLESALDRRGHVRDTASQDLKDFIDLVRTYSAQLHSFPINRAKVERAAMPMSAFASQAPPCVGQPETDTQLSFQTTSPDTNGTPSKSPRRSVGRASRKSGGYAGSPGSGSPSGTWGLSPATDSRKAVRR